MTDFNQLKGKQVVTEVEDIESQTTNRTSELLKQVVLPKTAALANTSSSVEPPNELSKYHPAQLLLPPVLPTDETIQPPVSPTDETLQRVLHNLSEEQLAQLENFLNKLTPKEQSALNELVSAVVLLDNPEYREVLTSSEPVRTDNQNKVLNALGIIKERLKNQRYSKSDGGGYNYSLEYNGSKAEFDKAVSELKKFDSLLDLSRGSIISVRRAAEKAEGNEDTGRLDYGVEFIRRLERVAKSSAAGALAVENLLKYSKIETSKSLFSLGIGGNDLISGSEALDKSGTKFKPAEQELLDKVLEQSGSNCLSFSNETERKAALQEIRRQFFVLENADIKAVKALQALERRDDVTQEELSAALLTAQRETRGRDLKRLVYINQARKEILTDSWEKQGLGSFIEYVKGGMNNLANAGTRLGSRGKANETWYRANHYMRTLTDAEKVIISEQKKTAEAIESLRRDADKLSSQEFNARYRAIRGEDPVFDRYLEMYRVLKADTYKTARLSGSYAVSNEYLDKYVASQESWVGTTKFVGTAAVFTAVVASGQWYALPLATAASFGTGSALDVTDASLKIGGVSENFDLSQSVADNAQLSAQHVAFHGVGGTVGRLLNKGVSPAVKLSGMQALRTYTAGKLKQGASTAAGFTAFGGVGQVGEALRHGQDISFKDLLKEAGLGGTVGFLGPLGSAVLVVDSAVHAPVGEKADAAIQTAGLITLLHLHQTGIKTVSAVRQAKVTQNQFNTLVAEKKFDEAGDLLNVSQQNKINLDYGKLRVVLNTHKLDYGKLLKVLDTKRSVEENVEVAPQIIELKREEDVVVYEQSELRSKIQARLKAGATAEYSQADELALKQARDLDARVHSIKAQELNTNAFPEEALQDAQKAVDEYNNRPITGESNEELLNKLKSLEQKGQELKIDEREVKAKVDYFLNCADTERKTRVNEAITVKETAVLYDLECCVKVTNQLVVPDSMVVTVGQGATKFKQPEFEPRLSRLVKALITDKELKLDRNKIMLYEETLQDNQMRKAPYVLINIPELNKGILVCNQIGEATFVIDGYYLPDMIAKGIGRTKREFVVKDGVRIIKNDEAQWLNDILSALTESKTKLIEEGKFVEYTVTTDISNPNYWTPQNCAFLLWQVDRNFSNITVGSNSRNKKVKLLNGEKRTFATCLANIGVGWDVFENTREAYGYLYYISKAIETMTTGKDSEGVIKKLREDVEKEKQARAERAKNPISYGDTEVIKNILEQAAKFLGLSDISELTTYHCGEIEIKLSDWVKSIKFATCLANIGVGLGAFTSTREANGYRYTILKAAKKIVAGEDREVVIKELKKVVEEQKQARAEKDKAKQAKKAKAKIKKSKNNPASEEIPEEIK
ncbi:MAG: hypothetical protein LBE20_06920 [Deltaproteobacteria bacterium]|jgi:hypothetical protein|nr:hypothetical protein [Deltaproteobacteria bacterium]